MAASNQIPPPSDNSKKRPRAGTGLERRAASRLTAFISLDNSEKRSALVFDSRGRRAAVFPLP
jgi:hypothetical protein